MNIVDSNLGSRSLISQERNDKNNVYIEIEDNIEPVNKNTVTKRVYTTLEKMLFDEPIDVISKMEISGESIDNKVEPVNLDIYLPIEEDDVEPTTVSYEKPTSQKEKTDPRFISFKIRKIKKTNTRSLFSSVIHSR